MLKIVHRKEARLLAALAAGGLMLTPAFAATSSKKHAPAVSRQRDVGHLVDWVFMALSSARRPTTMNDANAKYGLDTLDSMGEQVGRSGPRPGERH